MNGNQFIASTPARPLARRRLFRDVALLGLLQCSSAWASSTSLPLAPAEATTANQPLLADAPFDRIRATGSRLPQVATFAAPFANLASTNQTNLGATDTGLALTPTNQPDTGTYR